jgi:Uncharacterized conserved protein
MQHLVQTLKWGLTIRGVIYLLFGLFIWFFNNLALEILILVFGLAIVADGLVNVISSLEFRKDLDDWRIYLVEGIFVTILGLVTIFWPQLSFSAYLLIVAFWAIVSGIAKMVVSVGLRRLIEGELILLFVGVLSVIFGFILIASKQLVLAAVVPLLGFFSFLLGVFLLFLAWRIQIEHDLVMGDFLNWEKSEGVETTAIQDESVLDTPPTKKVSKASSLQAKSATTKRSTKKS